MANPFNEPPPAASGTPQNAPAGGAPTPPVANPTVVNAPEPVRAAPPPPAVTPLTKDDLAPFMARQGKIEEYLGTVHQFITRSMTAPNNAAPPVNTPPPPVNDDEFRENPKGAAEKLFETKMQPLVTEYNQDRIARNRQEYMTKRPPEYAAFDKDVDTFAQNVPQDILAKPGTYEALARWVIAGSLEDIVERKVQERLKAQNGDTPPDEGVRDPGGIPPSGTPVLRAVTRLTTKQADVAKKMGMSEDEYRSWSTGGAQ